MYHSFNHRFLGLVQMGRFWGNWDLESVWYRIDRCGSVPSVVLEIILPTKVTKGIEAFAFRSGRDCRASLRGLETFLGDR